MSYQSAAPSSRSNSIPLADQTIGHFTSGLPRRLRCLQSGTPHTLVQPRSSPIPVEPSEFHGVNPSTVSHVDNNLDWVNAPISVPTPVFQTSPPVADYNPVNNQLAEALQQLSKNLNRRLAPKPHQSKARIPDIFDSSNLHKLNHFLFQCRLFFHANSLQFSTDEEKINFTLTYLSGVAQDWFEVTLQQEDLSYTQPWLSTWHLFVDELQVHFGLLDPVGDAANLIDNLRMKPGDKIATYNVAFMWYAAQLNWGNSVLCHRFYQRLLNRLQDPIANQKQGKPNSFQAMYQLAITFDNCYWERNRERDCLWNTEKDAADSHNRKQEKMTQYSASSQNSIPSRPQSSAILPQTAPSRNSQKPPRALSSIAKSPSPSTLRVDLSNKLGRNGKLNGNEQKRRIDNNLCLYCGLKDHKVNGCPRKQLVRARLTTLEEQETLLSKNLSEN